MTGTGFNPSASVTVTVTDPLGGTSTLTPTSDGSGGFSATYVVGSYKGTYSVSATDGSDTATATFKQTGPDFTTTCAVSGTTIYCNATDNDGAPNGKENGAFVVFVATSCSAGSCSSELSSTVAFCAWTATSSTGATTSANCNYGGTFGGVGTSSLASSGTGSAATDGGATFTILPGASGTVSIGVVDCVAGSGPTSSTTNPCGPTGQNIDGSDCKTLGSGSSGNVCDVTGLTTTTTTPHGVPEFSGSPALAVALVVALALAMRRLRPGISVPTS